MNILALDSTSRVASAAVLRGEQVLSVFTADSGLTQSELLLPMLRETLAAARMTFADVDLYALTVGPGSFTGVRIGVATVKGLAFGKNTPCVPVSTLLSLAENLAPLDGILCPVMDARRAQVYNALFRTEDGLPRRLCEDRALPIAALAEELCTRYPGEGVRLCGDGAALAAPVLRAAGVPLLPTPPLLSLQSAASVGRCALRAALTGDTTTARDLRPLYLRMPQAERERLEKEKQNSI